MEIIFEVIDKKGRKIRLTKKQWSHIRIEHKDFIEQEDIKKAITNSIKIVSHEIEDVQDHYLYFKHRKSRSKYLKVVVKYLNGEGFIITAYFVPYIN